MKSARFFVFFVMSLCTTVSNVSAQDRSIVVPEDTKPFKVKETDVVRIIGNGIAGAQITVEITGNAKLDATNDVSRRVGGHMPIGTSVKEFEIKSTGKGKVIVKLKIKSPTVPETKVTNYEYEIE